MLDEFDQDARLARGVMLLRNQKQEDREITLRERHASKLVPNSDGSERTLLDLRLIQREGYVPTIIDDRGKAIDARSIMSDFIVQGRAQITLEIFPDVFPARGASVRSVPDHPRPKR